MRDQQAIWTRKVLENISRSENCQIGIAEPAVLHQRVDARAAASFKNCNGRTRIDRLYQQGSAKIRFPKVYSNELEAVLINTAGGITGGDRLYWDIRLGANTRAVATTQACEKAYRANGEATGKLTTCLTLEPGSTLHWLPQETILYECCNLNRTLTVNMADNCTFLGLENIVLGRQSYGERLREFCFKDRWRVYRDNKLIFADDLRLTDNAPSLARMNQGVALASLLFIADLDEEQLHYLTEKLRLACGLSSSGFSTFNGKITGRVIANSSLELRRAVLPVVEALRGAALPRVWRI